MFRTYKDKKRERFCKALQEHWNGLSYKQQDEFRKNYFGMYLTIMCLTNWNGTIE